MKLRRAICVESDPFDEKACRGAATWLMSTDDRVPVHERATDRRLCDAHKRLNERYYAKYYPNARVRFTRIHT